MDDGKSDADTSVDSTLDTKTYPEDFVSRMFNSIDWEARKKTPRSYTEWISIETLRDPEKSYTEKYLSYRVEEGQVDLSNPFHIEESNKIRGRLEKKNKKRAKEVTELNMMTEGLKAVDKDKGVSRDSILGADEIDSNNKDDDDDGDYLDEYGNLKEDRNSNVEKSNGNISTEVEVKENIKAVSDKNASTPDKRQNRYNAGWKDLDNVSNSESRDGQIKEKRFVKSAVIVPDALNKLMFPRSSSLTWQEQERFIYNHFTLLKQGKLGPHSGDQWTFYQNFLELVREEQEEFATFTREVYSPTPAASLLTEDQRKYVTEVKEVRLVPATAEPSCALVLEQTLLELGDRARAVLPDLVRGRSGSVHCHQLPQKYVRLVHSVPADPGLVPGTLGSSRAEDRRARQQGGGAAGPGAAADTVRVDNTKFMHKESCIEDVNCASLAQLLVPDVIISVSALKCLMDNHKPGLARTWDIPFVVRTFQSDADQRTVVIFGKPLVAREVTEEDCARLAHKVAVTVGLFQREWEGRGRPPGHQPRQEQKPKSPDEDLFGDADAAIHDLEVFGTDVQDEIQPEGEERDNLKIAQVDGGLDTDSESDEDNLVIHDTEETADPVRRSSRLNPRKEENSSLAQSSNVEEECLDYEPDEEPLANSTTVNQLKDDELKSKDKENNSNSSSSSDEDDDDGGELLRQKMFMANQVVEAETPADSGNLSDAEEVVSPKKSLKKITSDSEEDTEMDPVTEKLIELGKENVDRKRLKRKITVENNLKKMQLKKTNEANDLKVKRSRRLRNRNKGANTSKVQDDEDIEEKKTSDEEGKAWSFPSGSDSDSDEGERYNKFSSSQKPDFLDTLLSRQDKMLATSEQRRCPPGPASAPPPGPAVAAAVSVVAPGLPPVDKFKPPLSGCNVSYRMWRLYDKAPVSGRSRELRCIVRSKVAGLTRDSVTVTPSVKIEHQPQFGAEQISAAQLSREWVATLVRPGSVLARVRVTPDSKVAMVEERNLPQLTAECRAAGCDPAKQLANIHTLFSGLSQLAAGQYLLHHSGKTGAFCNVLAAKAEAKTGQVDLHKLYTTVQPGDTVPGRVAFTPIDTNVLTPWHQVNKRVPGTFEPAGARRDGGGGARGKPGSNRGGGRGRGGRGRGGRGRGRGKQ